MKISMYIGFALSLILMANNVSATNDVTLDEGIAPQARASVFKLGKKNEFKVNTPDFIQRFEEKQKRRVQQVPSYPQGGWDDSGYQQQGWDDYQGYPSYDGSYYNE